MSTLKTGALRGTSGTADSVQLHASNQSVTFPGNVTCSGTATGFGGGKVLGWAFGDIASTTASAPSASKITLFTQAYTPTDANSTILILTWVNIDARTSTYSDRIRIQGDRDGTNQQARWLIYGNYGNSSGAIYNLSYTYKPTGWTAGSSSTFKVLIHSEGSSGSPSDQYNTRLHENGNYLLVELAG